jgi:glycerol-3-phosphate dehydrogenase
LPLYGGHPFADTQRPPGDEGHLPAASLRALRLNHGSAYHQVLRYLESDQAWGRPLGGDTTTIRAEVIHAVRAEMACCLADVVVRRTELGSVGPPEEQAVAEAAAIMAAELGWNTDRRRREQEQVWEYYAARPITGGRTTPGSRTPGHWQRVSN